MHASGQILLQCNTDCNNYYDRTKGLGTGLGKFFISAYGSLRSAHSVIMFRIRYKKVRLCCYIYIYYNNIRVYDFMQSDYK